MSALGKLKHLRLLVACGFLSSSVIACTRWERQELSPERVVSEMKPSRILVTRSDSARVEIVQPRVSGDSLIGSGPGTLVSIPLSTVANVSVRKSELGGTIGLLLLASAAAVIVLAYSYDP